MTTVTKESNNQSVVDRSIIKYEIYLHVAILVISVFVILLSFLMTLVGQDLVYLPGFQKPLPESCTSKLYFGIDCPACGLTRGFISISKGDFSAAWNFNPASFIAYLFFALQIPWQSYQIWRHCIGRQSYDRLWIYYLPLAMAIALISQWAIRLIGNY